MERWRLLRRLGWGGQGKTGQERSQRTGHMGRYEEREGGEGDGGDERRKTTCGYSGSAYRSFPSPFRFPPLPISY